MEHAFAEQPFTDSMDMAADALARIAEAFPGTTVLIALGRGDNLEVVADWTKVEEAAQVFAQLLHSAPQLISHLEQARDEEKKAARAGKT